MSASQEEIQLAMQKARNMLEVAAANQAMGYHETVVNRSYYAVLYAATALLMSIGQTRAKHHGLYNAFSQYFVKPGLWPEDFAKLYRQLMYDRENHDYVLSTVVSAANAQTDLENARRFVAHAINWLTEEGWLS
ncbi:MAG: HEPN domain-containing protein [Anaerolineales bacterium]|nr:HEPN domain-containing protein [Anaerolineales bacterium]